jgi:hypothetical protein
MIHHLGYVIVLAPRPALGSRLGDGIGASSETVRSAMSLGVRVMHDDDGMINLGFGEEKWNGVSSDN